jgi:hypothetical protein
LEIHKISNKRLGIVIILTKIIIQKVYAVVVIKNRVDLNLRGIVSIILNFTMPKDYVNLVIKKKISQIINLKINLIDKTILDKY